MSLFSKKPSQIVSGRPSKKLPPSKPGVYRIVEKESGVSKYIGISNDLKRRQGEHRRSGKFEPEMDVFHWQSSSASYNALRLHEQKKIKQHQPIMNRNIGGGGRPPIPVDSRQSLRFFLTIIFIVILIVIACFSCGCDNKPNAGQTDNPPAPVAQSLTKEQEQEKTLQTVRVQTAELAKTLNMEANSTTFLEPASLEAQFIKNQKTHETGLITQFVESAHHGVFVSDKGVAIEFSCTDGVMSQIKPFIVPQKVVVYWRAETSVVIQIDKAK